MERYRTVSRLGHGSAGSTIVVERKKDKKIFCMKTVPCISNLQVNLALDEAKVLRKLHHKGIVKFEEAFLNESFGPGAPLTVGIVMELCEKGDLSGYMTQLKVNKRMCPESLAADYLSQIASALAHIHKKGMLHRDVKPQNVFIASDDVVKLGDFGLAMFGDSAHEQSGTPVYFSPEVSAAKKYDESSDVWGLGCIGYELLTLERQDQNPNPSSFLSQRVARGSFSPDSMPSSYSLELRSLVCKMLSYKPEDRPTASSCATQLSMIAGTGVVGCVAGLMAPPAPEQTIKPAPTHKRAAGSVDSHSQVTGTAKKTRPSATEGLISKVKGFFETSSTGTSKEKKTGGRRPRGEARGGRPIPPRPPVRPPGALGQRMAFAA